jgi:hypothetical protein
MLDQMHSLVLRPEKFDNAEGGREGGRGEAREEERPETPTRKRGREWKALTREGANAPTRKR